MRSLNRLHRLIDFSAKADLHFGSDPTPGGRVALGILDSGFKHARMTLLGLGLGKTVTLE
jgi:hypothetical protein